MPVSPLADAQPPEPPFGAGATPGADPRDAAAAGGGAGSAAPATPVPSRAGAEEIERGWTGLGLPPYEDEPVEAKQPPQAAKLPVPVAQWPAPVAKQPPQVAKQPPQVAKWPAPAAEVSPPAKPPVPAAPPAIGPPRTSGRSGAYPAAQPIPPEPAPFFPPGPPPRLSRPTPAPAPRAPAPPPRLSRPTPAPAPRAPAPPPRLSRPTPAPAPRAPAPLGGPPPRLSQPTPEPAPRAPAPPSGPPAARDASPTGTLRDPIPFGALQPALQDPPPAETDVLVEEEGDFGATIPETSLPSFDDLTATVPNLPPPAQAPSFGLPPPLPGAAAIPPPPLSGTSPDPIAAQDIAPAPHGRPLLHDAADAPDSGPPPYGEGALIDDKYRLIRVIGRGGMGSVWIAHNTALDVDVAFKLMRRDRSTPEAAARFTTEARAAARLGHPSIVRVFDFGETTRGDPYIVMELLHGESFKALLARKKKLAPTIAVQTLLPVAHALAAAHAKGIVHRDLKPDNILLAREENNVVTPKLVDFGIAKLVSNDVERHFTIAGEVLGSPDYMSPEQARGEDDIDHRSDIWTFSVLLYESLTGKRPFDGSNYNALLASIIASRPAPIADLGVPDPVLWSIVEKGLSKERDARWQSVREMGVELARWAIDHGVEHDLVGASLSAQWMEPLRKRLFTVAGSSPPEAPANVPDVALPGPPPLGALAAEVPKPTPTPATTNTLPPFVPRRRPWIVVLVIALIGAAIVYGLVRFVDLDSPAAPASSSAEPTAAAAPSPSATAAPAISTTAATTSTTAPTAKPTTATSAKARPPAAAPTTKGRAPQVKGNIKF